MIIFKSVRTACANDFSAYKPEWWALEGLLVLEESLVVANLVNRDYENSFVNAGDTVHVAKAGTFTANSKVQGSPVTVQNATATDTLVKLNQHLETTFHIDDREAQKSLPELRELFLAPAMRSIAEGIDAAVNGEVYQFYGNAVGEVGVALTARSIIDLDRTFNTNNNPADGRMLTVGPAGKADLYNIDRFSDADKAGNGRSNLSAGNIGDIMGMDVFMSQTIGRQLSKRAASTAETATVGIYGANSATISTAAASHTVGTWFTIAGVPGIYRLTAAVTGTSSTSIAFEPSLKGAFAANKTVTFFESPGDVKGAHTADGSLQTIVTDGYTAATDIPQVGQGITFGVTAGLAIYTVTKVSGTWASSSTEITLTLNRPLEATLADNAVINLLPEGGSYNMAFRKDAITLVNRPLAPASASVAAATMNANGVALRVTIGYDQDYMKHKVTVDTLLGVKVLDSAQGAILIN
jgi:hypothetical protein